jgi:hypothetical protein
MTVTSVKLMTSFTNVRSVMAIMIFMTVMSNDVGRVLTAQNLTNTLYETYRPFHPGGLHLLGLDLDERLVERAEASRQQLPNYCYI